MSAVLLSLLVAAAPPQDDLRRSSGTRILLPTEKIQDSQLRVMAYGFSSCVVRKRPAAAERFTLLDPSSPESVKAKRRLIPSVADGDCLMEATNTFGGVQMRFPGDFMAYTLADGLVRARNVPELSKVEGLPPLSHPILDESDFAPKSGKRVSAKKAAELADERNKEMTRIYLSRLGECLVRDDPGSARALLQSEATSAAEGAAFEGVKPALQRCVEEGQTLSLDRTTVRGTIALNYLRLLAGPGGSWGAGARK
jgi:hypothetical protein